MAKKKTSTSKAAYQTPKSFNGPKVPPATIVKNVKGVSNSSKNSGGKKKKKK